MNESTATQTGVLRNAHSESTSERTVTSPARSSGDGPSLPTSGGTPPAAVTSFAWILGGRRTARKTIWAIGVAVLAVGSAGAWWSIQPNVAAAPPVTATPVVTVPAGLVVRGVVRPAAWSRVGTQLGGVVTTMTAQLDDVVTEGQVLARVRTPLDGSTEVVAAPRTGTVTARTVSQGDSIVPGSTLFIISDVSSLRIEASDVDEFTVARVRRGQRASVTIPALDVQNVAAIVRTVGAQPVGASVPDTALASPTDHYPVTIDLIEPVAGLRIGMAARVRLEE